MNDTTVVITPDGIDVVTVAVQGPPGASGAEGAAGAQGAAGQQGVIGPAGSTGNTGETGPQGAAGATGPVGPVTLLAVAATTTAAGPLVVNKHNPVDATAAPLTMTLPTGQAQGSLIVVEKYDASVNAVTVSGSIRGSASTVTLVLAHETVQFEADAAGSWWPIAGHKTLGSLDGRYVQTASDTNNNTKGPGGSLASIATGVSNTAIGTSALKNNVSGNDNTAAGAFSQQSVTGSYNTTVGVDALCGGFPGAPVSGVQNTGVGVNALFNTLTGHENSALGANSLQANVIGQDNVAVGFNALNAHTGSRATAVGSYALLLGTAGDNTALGYGAGWNAGGVPANATTTGTRQTLLGQNTGQTVATAITDIVCVGYQALCGGNSTVAVGSGAVAGTGLDTAIGAGASAISGGGGGVAVGQGTVAHAAASTAIGWSASATAAGAVAIGADSSYGSASSTIANLIVLGTNKHTTRIPGLPAFVAGDHYLVVDSSGNIHKSAIGPAS